MESEVTVPRGDGLTALADFDSMFHIVAARTELVGRGHQGWVSCCEQSVSV